MNAARIISPSSSIDNRRTKLTHGTGRMIQRSKSLNTAAVFTRHHRPLSHQSSTAANAAAASFDRTTAHRPQSRPARERCGSSGLRSAHLDGVRVAELMRSHAAADPGRERGAMQLKASRAGRPGVPARRSGDHAEQRADRQRQTL
jgi:hypothetical protein